MDSNRSLPYILRATHQKFGQPCQQLYQPAREGKLQHTALTRRHRFPRQQDEKPKLMLELAGAPQRDVTYRYHIAPGGGVSPSTELC